MPILNDLIELNGLTSNETYNADNGSILGVVDGAILSGDSDNTENSIVELNNTSRDGGVLNIQGVDYYIFIATPENDPVTLTDAAGASTEVTGDDRSTNVAFIRAFPVEEGGQARFFAVLDDSVGSIDVRSLSTGELNFTPAGGDVDINLSVDEDITVVCFAEGTLIDTAQGPQRVETIAPGDLVMTRDAGMQPIAWVGHRTLTERDLAQKPGLCPIRIRAGALGMGVPATDLVVSPQHRILVRSRIAMRMFDAQEVLVAAKQLLSVPGIEWATDYQTVTYHHIMFAGHQIVLANGAEAESLFTGAEALKSVGPAACREIFDLFPDIADAAYVPTSVRPIPSGRHARNLTSRHVKNHQPLVT